MNIHYEIKAFDLKNRVFLVSYTETGTGKTAVLNLPLPVKDGMLLEGDALADFIIAFAPRADFAYEEVIEKLDPSGIQAMIAPPTEADIREMLLAYVDEHLDATAQERNYDGTLTICTYGDTGNAKFDAEGLAFKRWRSRVWECCYALQEEVLAGQREIPAKEALIALLPKMEWPS
ncbi:MAG: hypothetical protein GX776_04865 [Oxalobacter sp.]|nr:hypothetical protein [Oxalobacter sp.]